MKRNCFLSSATRRYPFACEKEMNCRIALDIHNVILKCFPPSARRESSKKVPRKCIPHSNEEFSVFLRVKTCSASEISRSNNVDGKPQTQMPNGFKPKLDRHKKAKQRRQPSLHYLFADCNIEKLSM